MGCLACVGENKPGRNRVRCVRNDAVIQKSSIGRPIISLPPTGKRFGFKSWATDDRLGTFIISRGEEPPNRSLLCELKALDEPQENPLGTSNQARKVGRPI